MGTEEIVQSSDQEQKKIEDYRSAVSCCHAASQLAKQQKWKEATAAYQSVVHLSPDFFPGRIGLARSLSQLQEWEQAILHFEKAIELNPDNQQLYIELFKAYLESGQRQNHSAYRHFIESISEIHILHRLAVISSEKQAWNQAIDILLLVLERNPNHSAAYNSLERLLAQQQIYQKRWSKTQSRNIPLEVLQRYRSELIEWSVLPSSAFAKHGISRQDVYPSEAVYLHQPTTVESVAATGEMFSVGQKRTSEMYVAYLNQGRAYADHLTSGVMTSSKQLLEDLSTGFSTIVPLAINSYPIQQLKGNVAFLSSRWGSHCYFHWMLDVLPRIELIQQSGIELAEIDYFVFHHSTTSFCQETLKRLNIPTGKLLNSADYPYLEAERLLVPSIMRGLRGMKWVQGFLRKLLLDLPQSSRSERIFISRRGARGRRVVNEEEVVEHLAKYGFRRVFAESMSVVEQAALLNCAEAVVAPHGSGLTNLIFCQPGTKVIELFAPVYVNSCYQELSNLCELDYTYLLGLHSSAVNASSQKGFQNLGSQDMWIDCELLNRILKLNHLA